MPEPAASGGFCAFVDDPVGLVEHRLLLARSQTRPGACQTRSERRHELNEQPSCFLSSVTSYRQSRTPCATLAALANWLRHFRALCSSLLLLPCLLAAAAFEPVFSRMTPLHGAAYESLWLPSAYLARTTTGALSSPYPSASIYASCDA